MILTVNTNHTCIEPQPQPPCQAKLPSWKSSRKALSSGEASARLACSSLLRNWDLCNPGKPLRAVSWQTLHRSPEEEAEPAEFRENESKNANERVQRKAMKSYHIKWIINDQCVNEWIIASTVSANMGQNFNIPTNPMANKSRQSRLWALPWACWLSKCFTILSTVHVIGSPLTIINDQWSMRVLMVARPEPPSKSFFWSGGNSLMTTLQCSIFAKNWKTMKKMKNVPGRRQEILTCPGETRGQGQVQSKYPSTMIIYSMVEANKPFPIANTNVQCHAKIRLSSQVSTSHRVCV